jgi:hypothetical protein
MDLLAGEFSEQQPAAAGGCDAPVATGATPAGVQL